MTKLLDPVVIAAKLPSAPIFILVATELAPKPILIPFTLSCEPLKVKLASPFSSPGVAEPVITRSSALLLIVADPLVPLDPVLPSAPEVPELPD